MVAPSTGDKGNPYYAAELDKTNKVKGTIRLEKNWVHVDSNIIRHLALFIVLDGFVVCHGSLQII